MISQFLVSMMFTIFLILEFPLEAISPFPEGTTPVGRGV